mmetsp:Transcript_15961/g.33941  ORF Transcript_15961/g.33941 Transcript_15961/m.33941 type:complete len:97 (+) Transcript_15961:725-1015(+)
MIIESWKPVVGTANPDHNGTSLELGSVVPPCMIGSNGFKHTDFKLGDKVVVSRTSGNLTVAEVLSVRPGWVYVKVDSTGNQKEVDEKEICRLMEQL